MRIVTCATFEDVAAKTAVQRVIACASNQNVRFCVTCEAVVAHAAIDVFDARVGVAERIGARLEVDVKGSRLHG